MSIPSKARVLTIHVDRLSYGLHYLPCEVLAQREWLPYMCKTCKTCKTLAQAYGINKATFQAMILVEIMENLEDIDS